MAEDDFELLERWRGGDRSAGTALFERYFDSICRFFANKFDTEVDDLVQRTFTACVENRDRFRGHSSFRTYIFGIAHNILRTHLRTLQRERRRFEPDAESIHDLGLNPSVLVAHRREEMLVLQALRRIPVDQQTLLELYYWESMTAPELGELFGIPEGTLRSRLRRAKELLERALRELGEADALVESTVSGLESWARAVRDRCGVALPPTPPPGAKSS